MDVLLLCGYRPSHPIGLETDVLGTFWIDAQITRLKQMGLSPTVVVAGEHADNVLLNSRCVEDCELVFDTNGPSSNLLSNLRSGLHATSEACYVLPVEVPVPPEEHWKQLKSELIREGFLTDVHIFQVGDKGAAWHYGFPLLISAVGRKVILSLENASGLTDERLRYHFSRALLALETQSL